MISLISYKEFGEEGAPSIMDFFEKEPYENKNVILDYLKKGEVHIVSPGYQVDCVSKKTIKKTTTLMNDGRYCWSSSLIYYVETYNLRLPKEFEVHVLNQEIKENQ